MKRRENISQRDNGELIKLNQIDKINNLNVFTI